jgi:hypothetical protein
MSAELVQAEDPNDPEVILRDLPQQERAEFLRQYHEAVAAAHDPSGSRGWRRASPSSVMYRAQLSQQVLGQLGGFPAKAFDALTAAMAVVIEYPEAQPEPAFLLA